MFEFDQDNESFKFLGFIVNGIHYCINLYHTQEIISPPGISKIPNMPHYVSGAINLRGKIVRVIDMRQWFKDPSKDMDEKTRIIILKPKSNIFGIIVDEILEVISTNRGEKHEKSYLLNQQPEISYLNHIILNQEQLYLEIKTEKIRL